MIQFVNLAFFSRRYDRIKESYEIFTTFNTHLLGKNHGHWLQIIPGAFSFTNNGYECFMMKNWCRVRTRILTREDHLFGLSQFNQFNLPELKPFF